MYEGFGVEVEGDRALFRLFLPDREVDPGQYVRGGSPRIREVKVIGDFQGWDPDTAPAMERQGHPKGWLHVRALDGLAEGYYQYKYLVAFENGETRYVTDPCAKWGGAGGDENAAFVIGGNRMEVDPLEDRLPPRDLVIYELMIDDFTAEYRAGRAPVDAVLDKLDHLQALGVNAIEFMPWTAWPGGEFSWGYEPFLYFSVEHRLVNDDAAPADKLYRLKRLITELHRRGMHVIMDGVFNHVRAGATPHHGFGYRWLYQDPADSPYLGVFEGAAFFEDLDYENRCAYELIRDACIYWLDTFKVDGIRFDYTKGFFRRHDPGLGIGRLVADLKEHLQASGRGDVPLILEHLTDNRFQAIDDTNRICATSCWFDPFLFGALWPDLRVLDASRDFAPEKGPLTYIENHDHSTVVSRAGGRERWYRAQCPAIALLTAPGTPMLHNGQEYGEDYHVPHDGDERVSPRPLRWERYGADFAGGRLGWLYRRLIRMRSEHPALRSPNFFPRDANHPDGYGVFQERGVAVYHRWGRGEGGETEYFIVVLNYADRARRVDIPFPRCGEWRDLLGGGTVHVEGFRLPGEPIESHWGRVYFRAE